MPVGGVSATIYGSSRATYDLAICYSRKRENVRRLVGALAPLHPYPRDFPPGLPFIWDDVTLANGGLFTLVTDIGGIDLIADVAGVGTYEAAVLHSTRVSLYGREVSNLDLRAFNRIEVGRRPSQGHRRCEGT